MTARVSFCGLCVLLALLGPGLAQRGRQGSTPTLTALGRPCSPSAPCTIANSTCASNNTCVCANNFVAVNTTHCGRSQPESGSTGTNVTALGRPCSSSAPCTIANSTCASNNTCVCANNFVAVNATHCGSQEKSGSSGTNVLSSPCNVTADCSAIPNSECAAHRCSCLKTHTPGTTNTSCLPISTELGSACETDSQCTVKWGELSACRAGKCACKEGSNFTENKCVSAASNGTIGTNGTQHMHTCHEAVDCREHWGELALCNNGTCACLPSTTLNGNRCLHYVGQEGANCSPSLVCYNETDGANQTIECVLNICKCKSGTNWNADHHRCTSGAEMLQVLSLTCLLALLLVSIVT